MCESLTEEQKKQVEDLLAQNADVLSDLPGCTHLEMHHVNTTTEEPIRDKVYPLPYALRQAVDKEIDVMLSMGIIRPSNSPYAAIPVIVKKPDGTNQFCVNYKKLNAVTIFDGEPMPNPDDIYVKMRGKTYRSKLDMSCQRGIGK